MSQNGFDDPDPERPHDGQDAVLEGLSILSNLVRCRDPEQLARACKHIATRPGNEDLLAKLIAFRGQVLEDIGAARVHRTMEEVPFYSKRLARELRKMRFAASMSTKEAAHASGISLYDLQKFESSQSHDLPTPSELDKLVRTYQRATGKLSGNRWSLAAKGRISDLARDALVEIEEELRGRKRKN